ncbi:hypothetical protein [Halobacterium litoreum]|uniref:Yip1 domain-containing protein n=1 Tax=Halobacterium litoreum TaxID=2039234 RepID=A0ABD5NCM3_9EURY|nr:hypothetical protein [Halobacterium litoreum]UHH14258.1 hypothetical protein LT972_04470 [Halobacterium litoreum]
MNAPTLDTAVASLARFAGTVPPAQSVTAPFDDSVVVFAASLLVGGVAIHVAASHLVDAGDYGDAILTALLGALAWGLLDGVPFVGGLLALVAWVGVIKWRYPVGWLRASAVGVAAWAVATVVLAALALVGIGSFEALGVPGA